MANFIAKKVEKENDVLVLHQAIAPVVEEAQGLVIKDGKGMKVATEMLSFINKIGDRITAEKEKVTKPLNEALKAERGRWKPVEIVYEEAIGIIRGKMIEYQTAEVKRVREEEARIAERVGEGKGKLRVETAVKKIGEIDRADEKVRTESGMVKFREDKVLKIVNEGLIPREYLIVDEKKVLDVLKKGGKVLGAELEVKMVPLNYR